MLIYTRLTVLEARLLGVSRGSVTGLLSAQPLGVRGGGAEGTVERRQPEGVWGDPSGALEPGRPCGDRPTGGEGPGPSHSQGTGPGCPWPRTPFLTWRRPLPSARVAPGRGPAIASPCGKASGPEWACGGWGARRPGVNLPRSQRRRLQLRARAQTAEAWVQAPA